MKRLIALAAAGVMAALAVEPVSAALPTPASGRAWDPNQRVDYRWKEGAEPPAWAKAAIAAAAADVTASRKSKAAVFAQRDDGPAWIAYTDDIPTNYAIGYAVRHAPESFSIRLRPHGTHLDWGVLRWCQFFDDPPNGCYDAETVTLHEFGHVETLGHIDDADVDEWTDSVMHVAVRSKAKAGWNQHVFGRCDVARLQVRYEALTSGTPISTCLDLSTDLSLSPSTSSVAYGSSLTLTAGLKISADTSYPNLASDPLSGRAVVLQSRALGATAWATIGDMSAIADDSGRYVKTLTLTSTYDWRAVFSAPKDEGLTGATSNVSRLSVTYGCTPTGGAQSNSPLYETC